MRPSLCHNHLKYPAQGRLARPPNLFCLFSFLLHYPLSSVLCKSQSSRLVASPTPCFVAERQRVKLQNKRFLPPSAQTNKQRNKPAQAKSTLLGPGTRSLHASLSQPGANPFIRIDLQRLAARFRIVDLSLRKTIDCLFCRRRATNLSGSECVSTASLLINPSLPLAPLLLLFL